jgi:hypothetical protein
LLAAGGFLLAAAAYITRGMGGGYTDGGMTNNG